MDFVEGAVLATITDAEAYPASSRRRAADQLIDVMARLHAVDPDAVGLGDLGRKEGYIARQLKRWHTQFTSPKTRELPLLDEVHDRLAARIPPQRWTGIVHGDFRLGNMILGPDGELRAVLDWELATLGDTLADLAWLIVELGRAGRTGARCVPAADRGRRVPDACRAGRRLRHGDRAGPVRPPLLRRVRAVALRVHLRGRPQPLPAGGHG